MKLKIKKKKKPTRNRTGEKQKQSLENERPPHKCKHAISNDIYEQINVRLRYGFRFTVALSLGEAISVFIVCIEIDKWRGCTGENIQVHGFWFYVSVSAGF